MITGYGSLLLWRVSKFFQTNENVVIKEIDKYPILVIKNNRIYMKRNRKKSKGMHKIFIISILRNNNKAIISV